MGRFSLGGGGRLNGGGRLVGWSGERWEAEGFRLEGGEQGDASELVG